MKNAQFYLPKWVLEAEKTERGKTHCVNRTSMRGKRRRKCQSIWLRSVLWVVCLFESGGKKIAVSSGCCDEQVLISMGVDVSIMGEKYGFSSKKQGEEQ